MRKLLCPLILLAFGQLHAQQHYCHTTEMQNQWFAAHPELKAGFAALQEEAASYDRELFKNGYKKESLSQGKSSSTSSYTIPVVFHILHQGGAENISDAQVRDAVDIL